MARSNLALVMVGILAACAPVVPPPTPAPVVVAPMPRSYTCEQSRAAAAEYRALPAGSALKTYVDDYGLERRQLRAVHGLPEPAACP